MQCSNDDLSVVIFLPLPISFLQQLAERRPAMLGYFAIYGGQYSELVRSQKTTRRWWQVWLPHQIDALN